MIDKATKSGLSHMVIFKLLEEDFAVEVASVREILRLMEISPLPKSPKAIKGVITIRGHIVPVIDLRKRFGFEKAEKTDKTRIMIVRAQRMIVGLIVDAVKEVQTFSEDTLHPLPALLKTQIHNRYLRGMARWNDRIVRLINLDAVVTSIDTEYLQKTVSEKAGQTDEAGSDPASQSG